MFTTTVLCTVFATIMAAAFGSGQNRGKNVDGRALMFSSSETIQTTVTVTSTTEITTLTTIYATLPHQLLTPSSGAYTSVTYSAPNGLAAPGVAPCSSTEFLTVTATTTIGTSAIVDATSVSSTGPRAASSIPATLSSTVSHIGPTLSSASILISSESPVVSATPVGTTFASYYPSFYAPDSSLIPIIYTHSIIRSVPTSVENACVTLPGFVTPPMLQSDCPIWSVTTAGSSTTTEEVKATSMTFSPNTSATAVATSEAKDHPYTSVIKLSVVTLLSITAALM